MPEVTLSPDFQITLPAEVLRALGLRPGERLRVEVVEGEIRLKPVRLAVRELVKNLLETYPEEARALGEAMGHDALGYVRRLREG
ncbi:AbrB/MazE/SpoVT family DNA-binding domain-containing protein [Thermus sp.]